MLFRAFYALPDSITGKDGRPVNALLGTANLILREVEEHSPRAVVLCFGPDAADYRLELFDGYHAERPEVPDDLSPQFADSADFFGAFGWTVAVSENLEADDLLGSYASREADAGGSVLVMTGDRDMFQCASDRITILYVRTGGRGAEAIDPAEVKRRYGVPRARAGFIALRGDPPTASPARRASARKGGGPAEAPRLARDRPGGRPARDEAARAHSPSRPSATSCSASRRSQPCATST